jgi:hypothetical protein
MRARSPLRQFALERLTIGGLALVLAALAAVPGETVPGGAPAPCDGTRRAATPDTGARAFADDVEPRTGIDLEVRVLNLRVEFPWMRALPISPGHRIVISLAPRDADDRRP